MKNSSYPCSVIKDTNRLVSTTESDWGVARSGSMVRIGNDSHIYYIAKTDRIFYVKDFFVKNPKTLEIKSNIGIDLMPGDSLQLSYKEYELFTLFGIEKGGSGYTEGQIVYIEGGDLSVDLSHNVTYPTSFKVTKVDENGAILELGIDNHGLYINTPPKVCNLFSHDEGSGAVIEVEYKALDNRKILERQINIVDNDHISAFIHIDYPLPEALKQGKLSLEKYVIFLTSNYVGETKTGVNCEICRDFTPGLGLPIMSKNMFNSELLFNHTISMLDQHITELNKRISVLEAEAASRKNLPI